MNSSLFIIIILLFSSCSAKYGLIAGIQQESYSESVDANSIFTDDSVRLPDYKNTSKGFHVGISEESNYFLTKLYYYKNFYKDKDYVATGTTYDTSLSEDGFGGSLALKLWWLQPHIGFKKYNSTYKIDAIVNNEKYSTLTYGLDLEIPLRQDYFIYLGYTENEITNIELIANAFVTQVIKHQEIKIGLRWNFASFGSASSKE